MMIQTHYFKEPFVTESGYRLEQPQATSQSWGELNQVRDNVILVCHALTGNTEADRWFGGFFGPGKLLDPDRHFILCINVPGSCYGSSGPASINPATDAPYRADFPKITIRDMVRFQQRVLNKLGISGIPLVIGGSMGGMQALEFSIMDPRIGSAMLIGMAKSHSAWSIALNHTQRQAIFNDPNWNGGFYSDQSPPLRGLSIARMIAMNSYRSPVDYRQKFGREIRSDSGNYQVQSYLEYQGAKLTSRFDAVSYVRLSEALDSHDVARGRAGYAEVLGKVRIPVLVVGIDSDQLYPVEEQKELASLLPSGSYAEIKSASGHDAFLIEFDQMNAAAKKFFRNYNRLTLSCHD